jgi:beta-glucosidase
MVTLHHFTHPLWFEDLGSFEDAGNIAHIARFTARVFREYGAKVPYWCTFNEPGPFSVMGWGLGVFPPGKQSPALLGRVIRNLCAAHVEMVRTIRGLPHGADVHVGLVKNIFQMDPWRPGNPVHRLLCDVADHVYNESILGFLRTGRVRIQLPGLVSIDEQLDGPRGDFVGLNYYANLLLDPLMNREPPFEAHSRPGQIMTDMPYTIYAEGFHKALHRIGTVGLPVYVTENGIPDARDDRRATWIRRYLYAMRKAMDEGVDVRGFYYWSMLDNFEWAEGYQMRFGLYVVDFTTQERRLRDGARPFIETIRRSREAVDAGD